MKVASAVVVMLALLASAGCSAVSLPSESSGSSVSTVTAAVTVTAPAVTVTAPAATDTVTSLSPDEQAQTSTGTTSSSAPTGPSDRPGTDSGQLIDQYASAGVTRWRTTFATDGDRRISEALVQVCVVGINSTVSRAPWRIQDTSGNLYLPFDPPDTERPISLYPADPEVVLSGKCVSGSLMFSTPMSATIASVLYVLPGGTGRTLSWSLAD